jgi:protein-tyrosine-phosphatase
MSRVIFLCTGNAARSVMATVIARSRCPELQVRGAGTFSIPGLPMSQRTRTALAGMDLADPHHRSHQLEHADAAWADLIVGFEPEHMEYVRRKHPEAAPKTGSLPRLARHLAPGTDDLGARLALLDLANAPSEPWEEVVDPAGGEQDVFNACIEEIAGLLDAFLPRLTGGPVT